MDIIESSGTEIFLPTRSRSSKARCRIHQRARRSLRDQVAGLMPANQMRKKCPIFHMRIELH